MAERRRTPPVLDEDHAAFIQGGVSVVVASRNADLVPDVVRGCGCRVSRDRRQRHGAGRAAARAAPCSTTSPRTA